MKLIRNINAMFIAPFFTVILLGLQVPAHADWSDAGMHPLLAPNFSPNQGRVAQHEVHSVAPTAHVESQHRVPAARSAEHKNLPVVNHPQEAVRRPQPAVHHYQAPERHARVMPDYFRRDSNYYGHVRVPFPYSDIDPSYVVPDGFAVVMVNGETFYYHQGAFYQQVGDQLVAIPAVLGAVVDSIPEDYQIVMADGVHYLFTGGIYYQRVDQGFEVVEPPVAQDF